MPATVAERSGSAPVSGGAHALISFLVGGWVAGRSAAFNGTTSGIMNGAMVWFVTIPLLIYLLGSGIGALARTAGSVAGTAAGVAGHVAGGAASAADDPALQATVQAAGDDPALQATAQALGQSAQATALALGQAATDPNNINQAAETPADTAWGTLLSLGLAAAAIGGGYLGAHPRAGASGRPGVVRNEPSSSGRRNRTPVPPPVVRFTTL